MKKFVFVLVCIISCLTMCAMSDSFSAEYADPDADAWPLALSVIAIAALVISQAIANPWIMIILLLGGAFCAFQNGLYALIVYLICVVCLCPVIRFDSDLRNMISSLWTSDKKE